MLHSILLTTTLAATASAACSRAFLTKATDAYVAAQSSGSPSGVTSFISASINYTENEKQANIQSGILSQPLKIDHNRSIHDTTACSTFTELIAASNPHPYVIGTRMLFSNSSKITTMESIVTQNGDWAFNATGYLYYDALESWAPIPESKRDSRAVIQAAGDAYFNRFANANITVPFGTPCARLEGGAYTGTNNMTGNTCSLGLPDSTVVTDRRYVLDETLGVVDMFLGFPGLDRSQGNASMPDSHMFRVEGGMIRYIHTAGCGMNGTGLPTRRAAGRPLLRKTPFVV
ncbi:hypothetical protein LSUE1_G005250 [Lachnellula suecica]|uniref:DUF8021 domain-containing protein n=1 Tax=Lachnellula suecica TaxID=602035 RepID=A0A8T9C0E6_9HELO|nr:hypothetical protein LSUE1_G005250 [Lachnellula suecica]